MARCDCRGGYFLFSRDRLPAVIGHCGRDVSCLRVGQSLSYSTAGSTEHGQASLTPRKFYTYSKTFPSPAVHEYKLNPICTSAGQRHEDHLPCFLARANHEPFLPSTVCATLQCNESNETLKVAGALA